MSNILLGRITETSRFKSSNLINYNGNWQGY